MISVSVPMELIVNTAFFLFVFLIYERLNFNYSLFQLIKNVIYSFIWGIISPIFDNFIYIIFLLFSLIIKNTKNKKNCSEYKMNLLIFSLVLEIIMSLLGTLFLKPIIFGLIKIGMMPAILGKGDFEATLGLLINFILMIVVLVVIKSRKAKILKIREQIQSLNLGNHIFWMLSSVFIFFEMILIIGQIEKITFLMNGTILISFISFVLFMCWQMINMIQVFSAKQKIKNDIEQNKQMNAYLTNIQEQYEDLRRFRHDFKNIILSMNVGSKDKTSKSYEELYRELSKQKEFTSNLDGKIVSEYQKITNEPLRGLIIQKFFKAKSNGIDLNVEILDGNVDIKNDILDVIRIVGILLDNAIEETINNKFKVVNLAFIKSEDAFDISIENTLNHQIELNSIFKMGCSTKGTGRGTGLANVNAMVERDSDLYLDTEVKDNKLKITLVILESG